MRKAITAYKTAKAGSVTIWWSCPTHRCQEFVLKPNTPAIELVGEQFSCTKCNTFYTVIALLLENSAIVRMTIEIK
jgi:hypothetical protein